MLRYMVAVWFCMLVGSPIHADDIPVGHNPLSEYFIDYSDLDIVLRGSVLDMGPSTHAPPKKVKLKYTSSRIQIGNLSKTRNEGNRVLFHAFNDRDVQALVAMRDSLLSVPNDLPLTALSRNEQLAYFLNLHTVIVLAEIAEQYPITNLKPLFAYGDVGAFVNQRRFELADTMVSLADIQKHVVENWQNPLVMYGFYFGAIGTPNIRTEAYTADTVFDQLRENAKNFVNSMRGTQFWEPNALQVSEYYETMQSLFPTFSKDVRSHILQYARGSLASRMDVIRDIEPVISDWNIADLYNGRPFTDMNGRYPSATRDANDVAFKMGVPERVEQLLLHRQLKILRAPKQDGTVDVEEISTSSGEKASPGA